MPVRGPPVCMSTTPQRGTVLVAHKNLREGKLPIITKGDEYTVERVLSNGDIEITDDQGDPNYFCKEGKRKRNEWIRFFTIKTN